MVQQTANSHKITYSLIIAHTDTTTDSSGASSTTTNTYDVMPLDDPQLTRGMDCTPAKLQFTVIKDSVLSFTEGDPVTLQVNGTVVFRGRVWEKEHQGQRRTIRVTCYDQIIYLVKNHECYVYYDKTAAEVVHMICTDFGLTEGTLANTQYKIGSATQQRIEDNKTLADIIQYALDATYGLTPQHYAYHLYDDDGKIMLTAQSQMKLDILIDNTAMMDFTYTSSIDKETYDMVKVVRKAPSDNGTNMALVKTGVAEDDDHIQAWGRLQYVIRPDDQDATAISQAMAFLGAHDSKAREIKLKNVLGDIRVRGGSLVFIRLNLGDIILNSYFMVIAVTHRFSENLHLMDLDIYYPEPAGNYAVTYNNDTAILQKIADTKKKNTITSSGQVDADASASLVQAGFDAGVSRGVSPLGKEGCVETALYMGSYYNTDLADLYSQGVAGVDTLCSDMEGLGYQVDSFDGYADPGDILIYGNREHVTVADGAGGCVGNFSSVGSNGACLHTDNCDSAFDGSSPPTEIIHMNKT